MTDRPGDQKKRGELRIYLGAAPGVGKTFAMLGEAHRRLERGTDVVAAVVETHGRKKTADLLEGIEIDRRRSYIEYRGKQLRRTRRRGGAAAHSRRWCSSTSSPTPTPRAARTPSAGRTSRSFSTPGITVISTVNVQHLESLNDVVTQITGIEQQEKVPDEVVRAADQIELVDITPEALRRRLAHGNVYAPERIDAALSNYFRQGNLTALRELALLWLADQVDAALEKYREDNKITDTWEARERVVVAVTGGAGVGNAGAQGISHRVEVQRRADGGARRPRRRPVRRLGTADGQGARARRQPRRDAAHRRRRRRANARCWISPATMNATQLVLGTSRRSRWARIFDEGIGATVVQQSGKIDVHMVTHRRGPQGLVVVAALAATAAPGVVAGRRGGSVGDLRASSSACSTRSSASAARARCSSSACWSSRCSAASRRPRCRRCCPACCSTTSWSSPATRFTIAEPDSAITIVVLLAVAVAVAALVDSAAKRAREARRASQEAELLALFAGSVLRGADLDTLLERVRETYSQRAVSLLRVRATIRRRGRRVRRRGPVRDVDTADTAIEVGDDEFWMLMAGRKLAARDRRVLTAVAKQAAGLVKQRELTEEAGKAEAIAQADELRRSLLSAVSHDLRTPLAAAKAAVSSLRSDDVDFSAEDTAELLATIEESIDQLTALVGNLLDSSRLAAGVVQPELRRVYLEEAVQRALLGISKGITGFRRHGLDRVKVEVGDAVVMADSGLLERVLANLIDNALRYAPDSPVRVTAGQVGDRVLIAVVDEGPGIPRGTEEQLFAPFQRLGDHDNSTGVGLGLSVARGFVEAMGGTISATDTPGGGLTVEIDLAAPPKAIDDHAEDQSARDRRRTADPAGAAHQPVRARLRGDHRGQRRGGPQDGRRPPARRRRARPRPARHVRYRGARRVCAAG